MFVYYYVECLYENFPYGWSMYMCNGVDYSRDTPNPSECVWMVPGTVDPMAD